MAGRDAVLARVWLGFAALGAAFSGIVAWMAISTRGQYYDPPVIVVVMIAYALAIAVPLLWVVLLALAGVAILRGRRWGRTLLLVHSLLGAVGWSIGAVKMLHGKPLGLLALMMMAAVSWYTAITLWRDRNA